MRERKRIARLLIDDVTLRRHDDLIEAWVRLRGGPSHHLGLEMPKPCYLARQTPPDVVAAIDELLNHHTDTQIANILNDRGLASGTGERFHTGIVLHIRNEHGLASLKTRLRERGRLTAEELAEHLGVCTQKRWRAIGVLHAEPTNDKEYLYPLPGPDFQRPPTGGASHRTKRPLIPTPAEPNSRSAV